MIRTNDFEVISTVTREGGEIDFIELVCPLAELKRRIDSPSRLGFQKLSSVALFEQLHADGVFDASHMPEPRLTIDTSLYTPAQAALEIMRRLDLGHST